MSSRINKFMCTVETKNYPVITVVPHINRYGTIRKKLSIAEINNCLASYATVTLHKDNGTNVKLNISNYRSVINTYKAELEAKESNISTNKANIENAKALDKIRSEEAPRATAKRERIAGAKAVAAEEEAKKETATTEETLTDTESREEAQADPEHPDTSDWSHIYGEEE